MKKPDFDVVALGELLIDFTGNGLSSQGNPLFEANPGGAPCNVLAMLGKLGKKSAFIGKVGMDGFGQHLEQAIQAAGIDTTGLRYDPEVHTTLAVVQTLPGGDRDFSFYRKPGADMNLRMDEVDEALIECCKIFHFGSLSMTDEPCRTATKRAIKVAERFGKTISFDPNLREPLWNTLEEAKDQILYGLSHCHILKISDNEIRWLTGKESFDEGVIGLQRSFPQLQLITVTAGAQGSYAYYGGLRVYQPSCTLGGVIETTGAGDTFCANVLNFVLENGLDSLGKNELERMLRFANAAAYLVTTKRGALRSMPERAQIEEVLRMWADESTRPAHSNK